MTHLGTGGGRHVGDILKMLLEVKRTEGELSDEELYTRVDAWWQANGASYEPRS